MGLNVTLQSARRELLPVMNGNYPTISITKRAQLSGNWANCLINSKKSPSTGAVR
jgi:hypothetical protein